MPLSIAYRCPLPIGPMVDGQRWCGVCSRSVVDLAAMTEAEALAYVRARPGQVCGRLRLDRGGRAVFAPDRRAVLAGIGAGIGAALWPGDAGAAGAVEYKDGGTEIEGFIELERDDPLSERRIRVEAEGWDRSLAPEALLLAELPLLRQALGPGARLVVRVGADGRVEAAFEPPQGDPVSLLVVARVQGITFPPTPGGTIRAWAEP